jgi:hypothetical protein
MNLIKKIDMFLLGEAKTKITPYLNSVFNKQDMISKSQAEQLVKDLDKVAKDISYRINISAPLGKGKPQIIIKATSKGDASIDKAKNVLSNNDFKIISSKQGDYGFWIIIFE